MYLFFLILAACASRVIASCAGGTYLQKRSGNSSFGYSYADGPLMWANLAPENSLCKTGLNQSPIDVVGSIPLVKNLFLNESGKIQGTLDNLGTTLQVTPESGDRRVILNRTSYGLKQFHFHSPSEHRINGESFPLEMHMVHQSKDNKLLVVGVLFDVTAKQDSTSRMIHSLANLVSNATHKGNTVPIGPSHGIDLGPMIDSIDKKQLQTYPGSLTTPPCSEGVTWVVYKKAMDIDITTYTTFKRILKNNSRLASGPPGSKNPLQMI